RERGAEARTAGKAGGVWVKNRLIVGKARCEPVLLSTSSICLATSSEEAAFSVATVSSTILPERSGDVAERLRARLPRASCAVELMSQLSERAASSRNIASVCGVGDSTAPKEGISRKRAGQSFARARTTVRSAA